MTVMLLITALFAQSPTERYELGRQAYERGLFDEAAQSFQGLLADPELATVAHFGLGNVCVEKAETAAGEEGRKLLVLAIGHYRTILQGHIQPPLIEEDVRFNLELAKQRYNGGGSSEDATASEPGRTTGRKEEGKLAPVPGEAEDDLPSDAGTETSVDQGAVTKPRPGHGLGDPGPLTREEALQRLKAAAKRIKQSPTSPIFKPARINRKPGDY